MEGNDPYYYRQKGQNANFHFIFSKFELKKKKMCRTKDFRDPCPIFDIPP